MFAGLKIWRKSFNDATFSRSNHFRITLKPQLDYPRTFFGQYSPTRPAWIFELKNVFFDLEVKHGL
jgi:hypothetical protein